jgi:succinoglycan biosynthesis transport protein ExoP
VILSAREPTFNPAVLMRHGRINRLLDELRKQYDLIVINAPAALATSDARMLTDAVDSTLLVARWGRTTTEQVRATMQILKDEVDGVVFNRVDYVEHARRGYGDSVQFYMDSAGYYSGAIPTRPTWSERFANLWRRSPSDAA